MLQLSKEQSSTGLAISVIVGFVNNQNCKFVYFLLEAVFFVNSWFKLVIILLYVNRSLLNKIIIFINYTSIKFVNLSMSALGIFGTSSDSFCICYKICILTLISRKILL